MFKKKYFMLYSDLPKLKYYKIYHENDIYGSILKKLWKFDLKQVWLNYCLINLSGQADKFMADNQFGKKIILLNKKKICLSANVSSDKFFKKAVAINVSFFENVEKEYPALLD